MKIALITTPPSVRSGIGDYTRHLLPYLREHCDVSIFVRPGHVGEEWEGEELRSIEDLLPNEFDHILYQLGNEANHSFMTHMIRRVGGTVMQHDWVLFDMALKAFPGLARGGAKGHALALREGGIDQARQYSKNWLDRRRQRRMPSAVVDPDTVDGTILFGWHEPEPNGRWSADVAAVRVPAKRVERVELELHADPGRVIRVLQGSTVLFTGGPGVHQLDLVEFDEPVLRIETTGIRVSKEQRKHGDSRRLGCFLHRLTWKGESGVGELDLSEPCVYFAPQVSLSRDRFLLPFNRSVVRFADSFIVHSNYVRDRIVSDRNATTPIGVVHHGAEFRWHDQPKQETRDALGLDRAWQESFLVTSFGGVQPHKRIDKALEALALARRERDDIRMVLAGSMSGDGFDPVAQAARLGISNAVKFTGFVAEKVGWDWLHAGNVALNLRGPSSGGTSGGIFQAFSFGRPVIASDAAEQRELPDSCVLKVPLGDGEVEALAKLLVELRDDSDRVEGLERAARTFVEEECHWGIVARKYVENLEQFPVPRVSRKRIFSLRLDLQKNRAAR